MARWSRRRALALAFVVALSSAAATCGPAAKYSDELLTTVAKLIRGSTDDATRYLDDAARDGKIITRFEAATMTWGGRINGIADDITQRYFTLPDEQAAARAFVVGTACDLFEKGYLLRSVSDSTVGEIVNKNRSKSLRPAIFGKADFVNEVVAELKKALAANDVSAAFPGLARIITCDRLG